MAVDEGALAGGAGQAGTVGDNRGGSSTVVEAGASGRGDGGSTTPPPSATEVLPSWSFPFCDAAPADTAIELPDDGALESLSAEAGFLTVDSHDYRFRHELDQSFAEPAAQSTRLFYAFAPADELPERAPLFLAFNGGSGAATTGNLRFHGTGPMSLDTATGEVVDNPASWTALGNLLNGLLFERRGWPCPIALRLLVESNES